MQNAIWNLKDEDLMEAISTVKEGSLKCGEDFIGDVNIESYMIDFTLRDYGNSIVCDFDVYLKGVDSGYGYLEDGTPYDYKDGGKVFDINNIPNDINEFKNLAKSVVDEFIINGFKHTA